MPRHDMIRTADEVPLRLIHIFILTRIDALIRQGVGTKTSFGADHMELPSLDTGQDLWLAAMVPPLLQLHAA